MFDNRKYNRLVLLRDAINENLPIILLYYPTWETGDPKQDIIKLEKVIGKYKNLRIDEDLTLPVPKTYIEKSQVMQQLIGLL